MAHIVVVDDEPAFTSGIAEYLRLQTHSVVTANCLAVARDVIGKQLPEVLLLDLMLPDGNGLELLDDFKNGRPRKIILITGHSGIKSLIGGMAGDGVTYMTKPIEPRELLSMIDAVSESSPEVVEDQAAHFGVLVGESDVMQQVYKRLSQVATTDSTVLVQGESGTGKELVADALHRLSKRKGSFIPVNCGGLSKDLVSSQLFGHEKGSFTGANKQHAGFFERANDGTLFLDEITEMPLEMQAHLLRVLETGKVLRVGAEQEISINTRLVAATNRDPAQAVRDGLLREDLYFRLREFPLELPPLRERNGDIALLAQYFLDGQNRKNDTSKKFSPEALAAYQAHLWPGNVRELKHAVHRDYILSDDGVVRPGDHLDEDSLTEIEGLVAGRSIADVERDLIMTTLKHFKNDKKAAAMSLGVSLKTLYNRLSQYDEEESN